ncbi:MAG: TlyA family RNA methyltransferase [Deltaproteobacteria bacterium]|nr:TlyA family RNA methyltransferase [Deltaproteobacteria bacterium]MBW2418570.1 TlyA family RNA methyltransferase [Deltaproteobacteria bacterium]
MQPPRKPPAEQRSKRGSGKSRLDERVVAEGLAESRSAARALILTGRVLVGDQPIDKAGTVVRDEAEIRLKGGVRRFVSRGGEKLAGALTDLALDPSGLACLDLGASTGGFTDCLLQAGATRVVALDVGQAQLHERLRQDSRVRVIEKTNARELGVEHLDGPVDLVVMDLSFISARLVLPRVAGVLPRAQVVVMVKPQFEVGREQVGKGGVVRDDALREEALQGVARCAEGLGYRVRGRADSRVFGPKGNREIFLWLVPAGPEEGAEGGAEGERAEEGCG